MSRPVNPRTMPTPELRREAYRYNANVRQAHKRLDIALRRIRRLIVRMHAVEHRSLIHNGGKRRG